jgi:hypothetical protein
VDYETWKTTIRNIDGFVHHRAEQKKAHPSAPKFVLFKRADAPAVKMGMGTTYGGQGQYMDVDLTKARMDGLCFKCRQKGHMACFCSNKKVQVHAHPLIIRSLNHWPVRLVFALLPESGSMLLRVQLSLGIFGLWNYTPEA